MSLVRVQSVWTGVAGAPFYTNLYTLGPITTGNGEQLHAAWFAFLTTLAPILASPMVATIDPELLEFNEADSVVTGAGSTTQRVVNFGSTDHQLPWQTQGLIQWTTAGLVHNRRVKGRTFLPGVTENQNAANGIPLPAVDTPVEAALATFMSTMAGKQRVWSRKFVQEDPEKVEENPSRPGSAHQVTQAALAPYWATLRSRRA